MIRAVVIVFVAAGCNRIFGLAETIATPAADAHYFDAPLDAPYACPSFGEGPPQYSRFVGEAVPQYCIGYHTAVDVDLALTFCADPPGRYEGTRTATQLVPSVGLAPADVNSRIDDPHLTPEGDQVIAIRGHVGNLVSALTYYDRVGDAWAQGIDVGFLVATTVRAGTPSRGPDRRMFVSEGSTYREISITASGTTDAGLYTESDFGLMNISEMPNLTADGLRYVVAGNPVGSPTESRVFYGVRPDLGSRFGTPVSFPGELRGILAPFLTADCSRVYFTAAGTVFYLQQGLAE